MTVQIDDAGWGSLIGGVIIGAYRVETQEYVYGEIPVELFQGNAFAQKDYLDGAAEVAAQLLAQLAATKDEPIQVCTGYVLTAVHTWLAQNNYNWKTAKITGPLQTKIETTLLNRLREIGLTDLDYETLTQKQGLLFWKCLRWLKGGNINAVCVAPDRATLAKTGWESYPIWSTHSYNSAKKWLSGARKARNRQRRFEQEL